MYCGAAFAGSRGEALSLLFFCRRFLFQIKRKCRNAECIYHLIMVRSEGKSQLPTNHNCYGSVSAAPITDSRKGCPYGVRVNKIVQISRADSICPYPVLFHYSLLVITLSASETTSQPRLTPSQRPLQGHLIDSSTTLNLPIHSHNHLFNRFFKFLVLLRTALLRTFYSAASHANFLRLVA